MEKYTCGDVDCLLVGTVFYFLEILAVDRYSGSITNVVGVMFGLALSVENIRDAETQTVEILGSIPRTKTPKLFIEACVACLFSLILVGMTSFVLVVLICECIQGLFESKELKQKTICIAEPKYRCYEKTEICRSLIARNRRWNPQHVSSSQLLLFLNKISAFISGMRNAANFISSGRLSSFVLTS